MTKKTLNLAVGTCACPIKDCRETVDVFKYRTDAAGDEKRRRFAGRLYCMCPIHGRIENQEFLLEHVKWSGPKGTDTSVPVLVAPAPPVPAAPAPPRKPALAPAQKQTPPERTSPWLMDYQK